jgi:hypothetical protein
MPTRGNISISSLKMTVRLNVNLRISASHFRQRQPYSYRRGVVIVLL